MKQIPCADLKIGGSYLNLDGGFDSRYNRKAIFNAWLIPNIKENPRNREIPKRGRKRLFNAGIYSLRPRVERTFAWEDKVKRLLLRFEFIQQRHYGMKLMAYTLANLRHFCGAGNSQPVTMVIRHCRLLLVPRRADLRDTFSTGFTSQCVSATSSRPCKGSKPWTYDIRDRWTISRSMSNAAPSAVEWLPRRDLSSPGLDCRDGEQFHATERPDSRAEGMAFRRALRGPPSIYLEQP
jgi:hypothetical protein